MEAAGPPSPAARPSGRGRSGGPGGTTDADVPAIRAAARPFHVPRHLVTTDTIPLLGAGKTDYAAAQALVEKELNIPKDRPSEGPAG
jgi:hypothetical protein